MVMRTIGAYDAKSHLSRLLDEVAAGERIAITKRGIPVAMLVPPGEQPPTDVGTVIDALLRTRVGNRLGGLSVREMIDEGRS